VLLAQALTSCGSDDSKASACTPKGVQLGCAVKGNSCAGQQTCNAEGTGFGPCECSSAGSAGSGGGAMVGTGGGKATGTGGAAGSSNTPTNTLPGSVGGLCNTDADCPADPVTGDRPLTCIKASSDAEFGLGGPAGGYCSLQCANTQDCNAVDSFSGCASINPDDSKPGYCIALCQTGVDPGGPNGATLLKCVGAEACAPASSMSNIGACYPVCTSDASCGSGRVCDIGTGLCVTTLPAGGGIGAACTQATEDTDCASHICLQFNSGEGFCSGSCLLDTLEGCGFEEATTAPRKAACLAPQFQGAGAGDIGFCVELCDTATDCTQAGWECSLFGADGASLAQALGRAGSCLPPGLAGDAGG